MYKLKVLFTTLMLLFLMPCFINNVQAQEVSIRPPTFTPNAKAALLMDYDTGKIVYSINEKHPLAPASITKLMTIYIVLEIIHSGEVSWNTPITTSLNVEQIEEAQVFLKQGEAYSLREMVKAMLIPSANDAAVAIAENIAGSETEFVKLMNAKAKELGLKNCHFINATGLPTHTVNDSYHYMSAYDIATLARKLIGDYPELLEVTSLKNTTFRHGSYVIENTNDLLGNYQGMDGLKTGFTNRAKRCLCSTAKRGDLRLISVILGAPSEYERKISTINLLNYGFISYAPVKESNMKKEAAEKIHAALLKSVKQHPTLLLHIPSHKPWLNYYILN
ncbi:MAG: D-alanyl-D-alanine carboxypeptidase [Firmicutes bacterium]|nr:D-alanyl-D-alanine carboxypeptidase [Bacillota bacterium]